MMRVPSQWYILELTKIYLGCLGTEHTDVQDLHIQYGAKDGDQGSLLGKIHKRREVSI